jgi:hypothetical protein
MVRGRERERVGITKGGNEGEKKRIIKETTNN